MSSIIVVTGAGRGIGKEIARSLYNANSSLVVVDVDKDAIEETAFEICSTDEEYGVSVLPMTIDLTEYSQVKEMFKTIKHKFKRIDILINNAGFLERKPFLQVEDELLKKTISTNFYTAFYCCQSILPIMKDQGYGKIVSIASVAGRKGSPGLSNPYAAAKAALINLTISLAREYGEYGINVNAVAPGYIETRMNEDIKEQIEQFIKTNPIKRLGKPEDVAAAVKFLVSDEASYITGQVINVCGGACMM